MYSSFSESWKENNGEEKTQNKTEKGEQDSNRRNHYFGTLHSIINSFVSHNLNLDLVNRFILKRLKKKKRIICSVHSLKTGSSPLVQGCRILLQRWSENPRPSYWSHRSSAIQKVPQAHEQGKNSQLSMGLVLFFHLATSSTTFIFRWSTLSCWIHTGTVCLHWWNHITEQYIEEICSNWQFYYIF